ncbi:sigma-54-dependent Fis family transcriptional regulator [candidate division KSB1 bacterium]|nr:sigma-54-dependent Fis family transcriptional regulator [candidate division KSB1 bacterium]
MDKVCQTALAYDSLMGESEAVQKLKNIISEIAPLPTTVLIYGEPGTGKELVARMIHKNSDHSAHHFVPVRAAGIPGVLLESALFGDEQGFACSSALNSSGFYKMAENGTLFLDEISDINAAIQVKLLQVLQDEEFFRMGRMTGAQSRARLICATSRNLKKLVKHGTFRQDLFYRLNIITLEIPPLRERREDIPAIAKHFVQKYSKKYHVRGAYLLPETLAMLQRHDWPGNVGELENVIEQFIALSVSVRPNFMQLTRSFFSPHSINSESDQYLPSCQAKALFDRDYLVDALCARENIPVAPQVPHLRRRNVPAKIDTKNPTLTCGKEHEALVGIDCLN